MANTDYPPFFSAEWLSEQRYEWVEEALVEFGHNPETFVKREPRKEIIIPEVEIMLADARRAMKQES
jgi:hypothetical protein